MTIPLWAVFGLLIAILQASRPLVQERYKVKGYALAIGNKLVIALLSLPFVIAYGMPTEPLFYLGIAFTSVIWCISDVYYFNTVEKYGAGPVSRILPAAIIVSFVLWFFIDPQLLQIYAATPLRSIGIALCILGAAWCATHLSRCTVSRGAFRMLWPTFAAATVGVILMKLVLESAQNSGQGHQAAISYAFVESLIMMSYWGAFSLYRRARGSHQASTITIKDLTAPVTLKASLAIGLVMLGVLYLRSEALLITENPAYLTVLAHTDVLWIILAYRLTGRKETSNVRAGLGIVACAVALIVLKSLH